MNLKSEQIISNLSVIIDFDDVLTKSQKFAFLVNLLKPNCYETKILNKRVLVYHTHDKKKIILLVASVTYLGGNGQHPIFKKRIQLPKWYKEFSLNEEIKHNYEVKFIGLYHYKSNYVVVDFEKDTYLEKKMNNSAAHVYINDLIKGLETGLFRKKDAFGNTLFTINPNKFQSYLENDKFLTNPIFDFFNSFNREIISNSWLSAEDSIPIMYESKWSQWKQVEWPGWFVEFKIDQFIKQNKSSNVISYIGTLSQKYNQFDFDLYFPKDNFYGDLKASDKTKKFSPGNSKENLINCLNKFGKFWYVIFEHQTIKDSKNTNYSATKFRNQFISQIEKTTLSDQKLMSYYKRMKHSVKFENMMIIEINNNNYKHILSDFNQGHQIDGTPRNPKFLISKRNIDNFVVYRS